MSEMRKLMETVKPLFESPEAAEALYEVAQEIQDLVQQAFDMIPRDHDGGITKERARRYWYAHMMSAIGISDEYNSGSATNMMETINDLQAPDDSYNDDGYEEDQI